MRAHSEADIPHDTYADGDDREGTSGFTTCKSAVVIGTAAVPPNTISLSIANLQSAAYPFARNTIF